MCFGENGGGKRIVNKFKGDDSVAGDMVSVGVDYFRMMVLAVKMNTVVEWSKLWRQENSTTITMTYE